MRAILVGTSGFSTRWLKVLFSGQTVTVAGLVNHRSGGFADLCREYDFPAELCFSSLPEALERCESDAVVVTIPAIHHFSAARDALLAGKHVLVEKPLTDTLEEAKELVALAQRRQRLLGMVSQHRFSPFLQKMKEHCRAGGSLGRPLTFYIRIHMNRPESYYALETRRTGRGVLTIQGAHPLDWLTWLFGEASHCSAEIGTLFHNTRNEDTAYALLTMRSGVMGALDINHLTRGGDDLSVSICFAEGVLHYRLGGGMWLEKGPEKQQITLPQVDPQFDLLKVQLENFAAACEGREELAVSGQDGLRLMRLLEALYRSAATGRRVNLK